MSVSAYWKVRGENVQSLLMEAKSDAEAAGLSTLNLDVYHCKPSKVNGSRVELWEGWAVICRDVTQESLSYILTEAEWQLLYSRSLAASQVSQS